MAQIVVELASGCNVLIGGDDANGLSDVGIRETAGKFATQKLEKAFGSLADFLNVVEKAVGQVAKKPSKVEFEFGISLTSDCNLWIVSGEGKSEFKVKIVWEKERT
jgi:hypothetical protein